MQGEYLFLYINVFTMQEAVWAFVYPAFIKILLMLQVMWLSSVLSFYLP